MDGFLWDNSVTSPAFRDGHVVPASSLWREGLALRGLKDTTPSVQSAILRPDDYLLNNASCMAVHNQLNYIAHGSITRGTKSEIQLLRALSVATDTGVEYKVITRAKVPGQVNDISWVNERLMVASSNGNVYMYQQDPTQLANIPQDELFSNNFSTKEDLQHKTFNHPKLKNVYVTPSPEQWTYSGKVTSVSINPGAPSSFFTLENHRLHVWDITRSEPSLTIKGSNGPLLCGQWNPHNPNELMISGVTRTLKLLDRNSSKLVVWKKTEAHSDAIRDLKWNPMIPHWVATAGNDGVINVWDLRYNAEPVISLEGHDNVVRKLSWSRIHCELLASGGADHQLKLWSLKVQPHHILATISSLFTDTVVGVDFSNHKPLQCFSLSAKGEFATISLTPRFLEPLVFSRFADHEQEEKDIEKLMYLRHFTNSFQNILKLARSYQQTDLDKALKLLEMCTPRKLPGPEDVLPPNETPKQRFKRELDEYSYYIPPNFPFHIASAKVAPYTQKHVENLVLNLRILRFVQKDQFKEILGLEKKILEILERDITCIETSTLKGVVDVYLAHDYEKGMNFVMSIGRVFDRKDFSKFEPIAKAVLSPNIYEVLQNPTLKESSYRNLNKLLQNSRYIFAQLVLQRDVICALWHADGAERVVDIIENNEIELINSSPIYLQILSVPVLRTYLNSLLCLGQFDRLFVVATEIMQNFQGYDFAAVVNDWMMLHAYPKLQSVLEQWKNITNSAQSLSQYKKIMMDVIFILYSSAFIPDYVAKSLPEHISAMNNKLIADLKKMSATSKGATEAVRFAREFCDEIDDFTDKVQTNNRDSEAQVERIKHQLEEFLDNC